MITDKNFKFNTSISREGYPNKETAKACLTFRGARSINRQKMAFKEQEVTVTEFLDYAVSGYSFCNLFSFNPDKKYWIECGRYWNKTYPVYRRGINKDYFKLNFKQDKFFKGSQVIFVDIDYTHYDNIYEYIDALRYTPTCVYTSFSDNMLKGGYISRRFRLVYVFDKVLNAEEFRTTTINLYQQIIEDTNEPIEDYCGMGVSQYMNGSNSNETYISNIIYSIDDIEPIVYIEHAKEESKKQKITFNNEMVKDMETKPYKTVVEKWWCKGLRYITKTEKEFTTYYSTDTENYYSLFWHNEKVEDGNHRRMKLFIRAAIRRLMKNDITPDELLYNLYIDRYRFFDNSDDELTIDVLKSKVKGAINTDISIIKGFTKDYKKPTFIINPEVSNKRQAIGMARKEITDNKIGEIYDTSKSVKENLNTFKELGIKISQTRLYKWVKENNANQKQIINYNPNLSIRENMKQMNCTKYQVEKARKAYLDIAYLLTEETYIQEEIIQEKEEKDYSKEFNILDRYFDEFFDGAADFFRFYEDYYHLDTDIKDNLLEKFDLDCDVLYEYYKQYQPWVGVKNYYGVQ